MLMSEIGHSNPFQEIVPNIHSDIFVDHETDRFAVGIVAIGGEVVPGLTNEYLGYGQLRANQYLEKKFISTGDLNEDGTESDADDLRSVHFTVVENTGSETQIVRAMRLIIKSSLDDSPLPVEHHYPEAFPTPATLGSVEDSRLIAKHKSLTLLLFAAGVVYVRHHNLGPVYGVIEPKYAAVLNRQGVPVTLLGEPKYIPEINATKLPIRVDVNGLEHTIQVSSNATMFSRMRDTLGSNFAYSGSVLHEPKEHGIA